MKTTRPDLAIKKEVGIWIRVSTEDQAQGDSPKHHETRARAYAESRGWVVRELYDLAGVSGKSVTEHPEAQRMMEDISKGHIQALIFSKLARLARNTRELLDFSDFFQEHNAGLVSIQESIDTSTPSGRLFYTIIAAMAQWEREEIADRIRSSIVLRAKSGKPLNGRVPLGYHYHEGKIQPHPVEAPIRRLVYEIFADNSRKKAVARILNERGFRTRNGNLFTDAVVHYLLRDPTARGEYRANSTRNTGTPNSPKKWERKPEHEWVIIPVEPIVSKELWEKCNTILDDRKAGLTQRPGAAVVHPFAGYVKCHCGNTMYVLSNTPKYVCRLCRNKISIVHVDTLFHQRLTNYLMAPEKVADYIASANNFVTGQTALIDSLKSELRKVKEECDKVFKLYYDGGLTTDQFKTKFQPLDTQREQLEREIPKNEGLLAAAKVSGMSTQMIMADAKNLHERWPLMTPAEKRTTVELLVRQILVKPDEVELSLCYLPTLEDMAKRHNGG